MRRVTFASFRCSAPAQSELDPERLQPTSRRLPTRLHPDSTGLRSPFAPRCLSASASDALLISGRASSLVRCDGCASEPSRKQLARTHDQPPFLFPP